ncbi:hypothetical protein ACJIZ3_014177 [Penstemon smallii]|uniref:(S)-ureidoglycine aminohydrolase cupin domain-containing protein n=1 Tax=Penstemon smallii TaxID=265156 RepID=A0ABD3RJJ1_9LAMI
MFYNRGKFNMKYEQEKTFYMARGKAKMHSLSTSEVVEFEAGHLVTQPEGLECRSEVTKAVMMYIKPS